MAKVMQKKSEKFDICKPLQPTPAHTDKAEFCSWKELEHIIRTVVVQEQARHLAVDQEGMGVC